MITGTSTSRVRTRSSLELWSAGAFFVLVLAIVHIASQALLIIFAGVLFGCALRGLATALAGRTGWRLRTSLTVCVLLLLLLALGAGVWIVPQVGQQAVELADKAAQGYQALRAALRGLGFEFLSPGGTRQIAQKLAEMVPRIAGYLASGVSALGAIVVVTFLALYFASDPQVYERAVVRLFPASYRGRMAELLHTLARTLRRWLLGRALSMGAVGVATALGLWLLGVPLPLTLGVISGALGFVPNIGPIVSVVPALLLAMTVEPLRAVYVLILYLGINLADGYALTPWVQKRAVSVPPAVILASQLVFGSLWGLLGVTFATPLVACLIVIVRELYVSDVVEAKQPARDARMHETTA